MTWMLKNSAGQKDGVWTLTVISFLIVSVCVILSMFEQIAFGKVIFVVKTPDVALLTLYLGMTGTGYVWRRGQKLKDGKVQETSEEVEKNVP